MSGKMDLATKVKRDSSNGEEEKIAQPAPTSQMAAKYENDSNDERSRSLDNADVDDVYMVTHGLALDGSSEKLHSPVLHIPIPDEQQVSNFLMENKNTNRKTGADMKILISYLKSLNEKRPPECLPPIELDKYLSSFFMVVRKFDGAEYEPCSLRAMLASIERYLKLKSYPTSLTRDLHFAKTRAALKLKQQMLKQMGKGIKSQICSTSQVMEQRLSQLCKSQEFGPYSPVSILFSLCFVFVMNLKMRKATEHKKLLWGDIMLGVEEETGREYLAFSPQIMHRAPNSSLRLTQDVIWSKPDLPEQDPVALYRLYMEKRPVAANHRYSPFYLGVNVNQPAPAQSWYRPCALGMNKLNEMVRQIRDLTGMAAQASSELSPLPADGGDSNCESLNADSEEAETDNYAPLDIKSEVDAPRDLSHHDSELDSSDSLSYQSLTFNEDQAEDNGELPDGFHGSGAEFASDDIVNNHASGSGYPERSAYIDLSTAKQQLSGILQQMDILDLVAFDHWLKRMKIGRDTHSGKIVCREDIRGMQNVGHLGSRKRSHDSDNSNGASPDKNLLDSANITLNICLTPQAILGGGPVTVTAHASSYTNTDSNNEDVLLQSKSQEKTTPPAPPPPPSKASSTAGIAKSPYPLHIFDGSASKHPRLSSGTSKRDGNSQKSNSAGYLKQFSSGQGSASTGSNSSRTMTSYLSIISKTNKPELSIVKTVLQQTLRPKTESSKSASLYHQLGATDLTNGHSLAQEPSSRPVFPKPEPV